MCKIMFECLIVLMIVFESEANLKLIFSDEFNGNDSIDENKWNVRHETNECKYKLMKI